VSSQPTAAPWADLRLEQTWRSLLVNQRPRKNMSNSTLVAEKMSPNSVYLAWCLDARPHLDSVEERRDWGKANVDLAEHSRFTTQTLRSDAAQWPMLTSHVFGSTATLR
jgi:hypothetical protein